MVGGTTLSWQQHELSGVRRGQEVFWHNLKLYNQVFARVLTMLSSFFSMIKLGQKRRTNETVYCALCEDEAVVCSVG